MNEKEKVGLMVLLLAAAQVQSESVTGFIFGCVAWVVGSWLFLRDGE